MKTKQNIFRASFIISFCFLLFSCGNEFDAKSVDNAQNLLQYQNEMYNLSDNLELLDLLSVLRKNEFIDYSSITSIEFKHVMISEYEEPVLAGSLELGEGKVISVSILLDKIASKREGTGSAATIYSLAGCVMNCIADRYCTTCKQTITEKCKSQTCTCSTGDGGCSASTIFTS